ncbi:hypothetical protein BGZ49_005959 [Haplosporangium sp. Z 27]|nr:hypothetical protein BGZ49_005959 [Haplosporangium sp. Z 27]
MTTQPPEIYSLKIILLGSRPQIWRRVHVDSSTTLSELHIVFQAAMGWRNCHMHQFEINGKIYETGLTALDLDLGELGMGVLDGNNVKLKDVAGVDDRFIYNYDMGDDWQHEVRVEKIVAFKPRTKLPSCTGGARACPPEDCGGIYGYADLMKTMAGPDSDEKEELSEWLEEMGVDFDPEYFDKAEANLRLEFYKTIM